MNGIEWHELQKNWDSETQQKLWKLSQKIVHSDATTTIYTTRPIDSAEESSLVSNIDLLVATMNSDHWITPIDPNDRNDTKSANAKRAQNFATYGDFSQLNESGFNELKGWIDDALFVEWSMLWKVDIEKSLQAAYVNLVDWSDSKEWMKWLIDYLETWSPFWKIWTT